MTDRPHLSPTQLDMHARCQEQYRRRYLEGEIIPPAIAMAQGKSIHVGAETNNRQKIETHEDLSAADIIDASIAAFEEQIAGEVMLSEEESARGSKVVIGEAKDETVSLARLFAEQSAPDYQPVLVEERVTIELPKCSHDILGIIDLVDDRERVTDYKVSKARKSQVEADTSTQLTFYAAAKQKRTGTPASEVRLDNLVKNKKPVRQVVSSTRNDEDFDVLANRINAMLASLQTGVFTPAPAGAWWCSDKFCGYARTCPFYRKRD